MKKVILKFFTILIITIFAIYIIVPQQIPKISKLFDIVSSRFQVGIYNTFTNKVHAENESATKIAITFDDGFECVYNVAYPILDEHGYTASLAIIGGRIGEKGYLNYRELCFLYNNGYEILNHSYNHIQNIELNENELLEEYELNKLLLKIGGLKGSDDIIIAPGGKYYYNHVSMITNSNFRAIRSLNKFYLTESKKNYDVKIINIYCSKTIKDIIEQMKKAIDEKQNIILIFHKISNNPPNSQMFTSTETFTEIIQYINNESIDVVSYNKLLDEVS